METVLLDLRHALRTLRRSPSFTVVAVLTLAVGLGMSTAIFSVVNTVLLRPLPVERPGELVEIYTATTGSDPNPHGSSSYPDYLDLRDRAGVFEDVLSHSLFIGTLSHEGRSDVLIGEVVSGNYFPMLGVRTPLGRGLLPDDAERGAPPVVVLGHSFWRTRLGADPGILDSTLKLNGVDVQVVGVAPSGFPGTMPAVATTMWIPVSMVDSVEPMGEISNTGSVDADSILDNRGYRWTWMKGRLDEGVGVEQAEAGVRTVMARLEQEHPATNEDRSARVLRSSDVGFHPDLDAYIEPAFALVFGVVGLVLLVACANVANMLLARAATRRKEVAIRLAIGAGRGRLIRQFLAESVVVALAAGALGLLLAVGAVRALSGLQPPFGITLPIEFAIDHRVFLFVFAASLVTGALFGLVPALQAARPDLVPALEDDPTRGQVGGGAWLQRGLIVGQVCVSVVLLVGGLLLTRSLRSAELLDPGFDARRVVKATVAMEFHGYDTAESMAFFESARRRLRALPGVESVSWTTRSPLSVNRHTTSFVLPDRIPPGGEPEETLSASNTSAAPGYFEALGLEIVRGRAFGEGDRRDAPPVVIVNQAFVRRYWPDQDPIGKLVRSPRDRWLDHRVVGVVEDHKVNTLGESPTPMLIFSHLQRPTPFATFLVRTSAAADPLVETVRRELTAMEPELAFLETGTLWDNVIVTLWPLRMAARILGGLGLLAVLLAAVGLYGIVSRAVSRRTREIGIRMALGARGRDVVTMVLRQGMALVGIGAVAGIVLAAAGTRLLSSVLYGVSAADPPSFAGAAAAVLAIALAAHYVPARRATRVDPIRAVKTE